MRTKPLSRLYDSYERRSQLLNARFSARLPQDPIQMAVCDPIHRDGRAHLVVRLQHLWGEFCKELIVRSAIGGCETRTGQALPRVSNVKRVSDIPKAIGTQLAGPRAKWEEPSFTIGHASRLHVANYNAISIGLSSISLANITNIKCLRNYLVHPNSFTGRQYAQMAGSLGFRGLMPDQLLSQFLPGSVTMFEAWVSDLLSAAWDAVA